MPKSFTKKQKQKKIITQYLGIIKKMNKFPTTGELAANGITWGRISRSFGNQTNLENYIQRNHKKEIGSLKPQRSINDEEIFDLYQKFLIKNKKTPNFSDFSNMGVTKDILCNRFGSLSRLEKLSREKFPNSFPNILLDSIFTEENVSNLRTEIKKYNRFIVTTAVSGCEVDSNFYKSIKFYCKKNNAKLLVLVASDPAANVKGSIDKVLSNESIVVEDTHINSNIFLSTIKLSAKHIDPITSLGRIGQRSGSFVYASPKQRLKMVPVSNVGMPHALMTTGAITKPNYSTDRYMSERTAYIAGHDHIMGGIIIELVDDKIYHYRQIQCDEDGSFIDLGIEYTANGKTKGIRPEAFVLGDWHSGETDAVAASVWFDILKKLKPKSVVLHDAFNGMSINHHEKHQNISLAKKFKNNQLNLSSEIEQLSSDLAAFSAYVEKIVVVKSNHDEFLNRYLQEGLYVKDPQNHLTGVILAKAMLEGKDPLQFAVESVGDTHSTRKIKWLKRDDDYKICGIQLAAHGDKGPNGARGNVRGMENAYRASVTGHSHTPEILRGAWSVGTSSHLRLGYNSGPSSWLHTSCLVYKNGQRQLINNINGNWRLKK